MKCPTTTLIFRDHAVSHYLNIISVSFDGKLPLVPNIHPMGAIFNGLMMWDCNMKSDISVCDSTLQLKITIHSSFYLSSIHYRWFTGHCPIIFLIFAIFFSSPIYFNSFFMCLMYCKISGEINCNIHIHLSIYCNELQHFRNYLFKISRVSATCNRPTDHTSTLFMDRLFCAQLYVQNIMRKVDEMRAE